MRLLPRHNRVVTNLKCDTLEPLSPGSCLTYSPSTTNTPSKAHKIDLRVLHCLRCEFGREMEHLRRILRHARGVQCGDDALSSERCLWGGFEQDRVSSNKCR